VAAPTHIRFDEPTHGCDVHTAGGYLVYAAMTHRVVFNYQPGTTVMFESIPTYPDDDRYWQIVDDLKVHIFYTAPTAIRAMARG
jgi:acetyl-CoA synthetase